MKTLLVLASPEYLRFFDAAIVQLAARGHEVHAVFGEAAEYKPVGLSGAAALPLASVQVVPPPRTFWGDTAFAYRAVVDFLRFLHPDYADAPVLRERIRRKLLPAAFQWLDRIASLPVAVLDPALAVLRAGERAIPVDPAVRATLERIRPDLVVVSPLVDAGSAQVDWVKGAQQQGIAAAVAVASWDNLTNKGLMRVRPDRVLVWNDIQRDEAVRYHAVAADTVEATGAAVFDQWFGRRPSSDRGAFAAAAGLPDARPFVLFAGSSPFITDAGDEVELVRRWIRALRASADAGIRELGVLVRPHPYNTQLWQDAAIDDAATAVWPRGAYNPATEEGRRVFFDSLAHSVAVVGVNTTAMIEAAIAGRPVLTISEFSTQRGTKHFHYLLSENGGPVIEAATLDAHVDQVASVLRDPSAHAQRTAQFVHQFVRPGGLADPVVPRLVDALERAARLPAVRRSDAAAQLCLGPGVAAFGLWVAAFARLTGPDPFVPIRKSVLDPVRTARRQLERRAAVVRERTIRQARLTAHRAGRASQAMGAAVRQAPAAWRRARRAIRQARYTLGVMRRGQPR